jgi:hypothetical protein
MGLLAKRLAGQRSPDFLTESSSPGVLSSGSQIRRSHRVLNQGKKVAGATG